MKGLFTDPIQTLSVFSNQNQGTTEKIISDIEIVLSSKSTIDNFTKKNNYLKIIKNTDFPYLSRTKFGNFGKRFLKQEHLNKYFWLVFSLRKLESIVFTVLFFSIKLVMGSKM